MLSIQWPKTSLLLSFTLVESRMTNRAFLTCPQCQVKLTVRDKRYICRKCHKKYPIKDGIINFLGRRKTGGYLKSYYKMIDPVEKNHFWFRGRQEIIYTLIKDLIDAKQKPQFLEIGYGTGNFLLFLAKKNAKLNLFGVDIFKEGLAISGVNFKKEKIPEPCLIRADAQNLPLAAGSQDFIGLFDVLEHIENEVIVLREARRVLKNKGCLTITLPAYKFPCGNFDKWSPHQIR